MRRLWWVILAVMLMAVVVAPGLVLANDTFSIGSNTYYVNGQAQTMDVAPYIEDGRTMLPVRYVAEALGIPDGNIRYDQDTQTVTIIDVGSSNGAIKLTIGSDVMSVVGGQVTMDTTPEIRDGRVFLPIHWIAQGLGANISWDPDNQQVTIGGGGSTPTMQQAPVTVTPPPIITSTTPPPEPNMYPCGGTWPAGQSVTVTISNAPSGDTAYLTMDGSNPETSSTRVAYSGAFTVSQALTINAAIQDPSGNWSGIAAGYFEFYTPSASSGGGGGPGAATTTTIALPDVANTLGISASNVMWDPTSQKVTIIKGQTVAQFTVGSNIIILNGQQVTMNTTPTMDNGVVYLPLAWLQQALQ